MTSATSPSSLAALAAYCLGDSSTVQSFLDKNSIETLSLSSFPKTDETAESARQRLRNNARQLYELATGPQELLMENSLISLQWMNAMRYICHYRIPDPIPENESIEYSALAKQCGVDESQMKQALRFAMTYRLFKETEPGKVSHTSGSRLLVEGNAMRPFVQWLTEDCAPMMVHQIHALETWGHGSQEPNQTAVNSAYGNSGPFYEFIPADPVRERRFGTTIQQVSQQSASAFQHIQLGFDWKALGEATVIDVGGHVGYCAVAIAQASPSLRLIVQDRPEVVAMAQEKDTSVVPADLVSRLSFEEHDFYQPQKTAADVYFFRKTLLNHTDKYASKIVAALSPVLKPGNRLLIMDFLLEEGAVGTSTTDRYYRAVDLQMLLYYNCRYRSLQEWIAVVQAGDPKFTFERACTPEGSGMAILSFLYQ